MTHTKTRLEGNSVFPKITALICTLNEADNITHVLSEMPPFVYEVVLVDGRSHDNTVEIARRIFPGVRLFCQPRKGKDDALMYGIEKAKGDIIVALDADGSTKPEEMPRFIAPLLKGYDFAKGSRFLGSSPLNMPWHRKLANRVFVVIANILFGTKFTDLCSGYNAFWKSAFTRIRLEDCNWRYEPKIILRALAADLKMVEVGHFDKGRISGKSKLPDLRQGLNVLKTILEERFCG